MFTSLAVVLYAYLICLPYTEYGNSVVMVGGIGLENTAFVSEAFENFACAVMSFKVFFLLLLFFLFVVFETWIHYVAFDGLELTM